MRKSVIFIVLAFLLMFYVAPVYAQPALPHAFYGNVTVNGSPAPDGTQVSARVDSGDVVTNAQNPVTTAGGSYGINSPRLLVQGDISNGATITFYVNGYSTGRTAAFEAGGGPTELNLTVTISAGDGADGVGVAPPAGPTTVEANLFGGTVEFSIDSEGVIQETIEATSEDGNLTITIPEDTIALDKDGDPLDSLETAVDESPPSPPEGADIIGLAYDFGPDGATFDPPITFTWKYDPEALPEGVAEEDLVLAYYDEGAGKWVEIPSAVDTETNTITTSVSHFTIFAIIGTAKPAAFTLTLLNISPTEVSPGEQVTITVSVANTGGREGSYTVDLKVNGAKEAKKAVTLAAGESRDVSFTVTRDQPGSYSVDVNGLKGNFTVAPPAPPPPAPAAFSVTNLSVKPAEVEPNEPVIITVSLSNTGGSEGSYSIVLKINGVKEAEKSVTIAGGGSEVVTFSVTKEELGNYSVAVDGLSASFTVIAPPVPPAPPPPNWPLIGAIIAATIVVGLLIFFLIRRRAA